jgi:hypothetical protein
MTAENANKQVTSGNNSNKNVPVTGYKNCGIIPDFKMGASKAYKGVGNMQIGSGRPTLVDKYNNMSNSGYGYSKPGIDGNRLYADSYPPVTSTSHLQKCGKGGKRKSKKMRKRKGKKMRKSKKHMKRSKKIKKKQSGGYAQYMSNVPLTYTMQLPNGPNLLLHLPIKGQIFVKIITIIILAKQCVHPFWTKR